MREEHEGERGAEVTVGTTRQSVATTWPTSFVRNVRHVCDGLAPAGPCISQSWRDRGPPRVSVVRHASAARPNASSPGHAQGAARGRRERSCVSAPRESESWTTHAGYVDGSSPPQPLHELEGVTCRICHEEAPDAGVRGILRRLQHLYSCGGGAAVPGVNIFDDPRDHHRLRRGGLVKAVALLDGPDGAPSSGAIDLHPILIHRLRQTERSPKELFCRCEVGVGTGKRSAHRMEEAGSPSRFPVRHCGPSKAPRWPWLVRPWRPLTDIDPLCYPSRLTRFDSKNRSI